MSATTYSPRPLRIGLEGAKGPLLLLILSIVVFTVSRRTMTSLGQWAEIPSFVAVLAAFAGAFFIPARYRDVSPALRIVTGWIGIIVFVQVIIDAFGPFPGPPNILFGAGPAPYFRFAAVIGVTSGLLAFWRPSFLIPLFLYYVGWRELIGTTSGVAVSDTDYLGMLDVGYFSTVGMLIVLLATSRWAMNRFPSLQPLISGVKGREAARKYAFDLIWACAVGAHLGSYFWSGVMKIHVGGAEPLTWVLHNPTQIAILLGLERGDNPLATWPGLLQAVWDGIIGAQPYMNAFILGIQLLAPLAALGAPILSVLCLLFDAFHIGVYLTLGALFFFWIGLNLVIVAAATTFRGGFTPSMKIVMAATTLFGHFFFYTNYLGWLDGAKLASPQFQAITRDNRKVSVPPNYFGVYSYTIAQAAMYIPDDHFKFRLGGNSHDLRSWQDARNCDPKTTVEHQSTGVSLAAVEDMVRETDSMMRKYPAIKNDNLYYIYPHHMLPNPWMFGDFNNLKIDDIVGYEYSVDSVCLSMKDGRLNRDVYKHSEFPISLE